MVRPKTTEEIRESINSTGETLDNTFVYTNSKDTNNLLPIKCQYCGEVLVTKIEDVIA